MRFVDPTGHSVDCGLGDPYCRAGKLDTKKRGNDLVASYSRKASRSGTTVFYGGLSRDEQRILAEGGWDEAAYNDVHTGTIRDARGWEDPLTYAEACDRRVRAVEGGRVSRRRCRGHK